jgi:hypothetical protein
MPSTAITIFRAIISVRLLKSRSLGRCQWPELYRPIRRVSRGSQEPTGRGRPRVYGTDAIPAVWAFAAMMDWSVTATHRLCLPRTPPTLVWLELRRLPTSQCTDKITRSADPGGPWIRVLWVLVTFLRGLFAGRAALTAEPLVLRQQLAVLQRSVKDVIRI